MNKKNILIILLAVITMVYVSGDLLEMYSQHSFRKQLAPLVEKYSQDVDRYDPVTVRSEVRQVFEDSIFLNTQAFTNDGDAEAMCWDWASTSPQANNYTYGFEGVVRQWEIGGFWGAYLSCLAANDVI